MKTVGLAFALILAIALTIAVVLGILFLFFGGGVFMWDFFHRRSTPTTSEKLTPTQKAKIPFFLRARKAHTDTVLALAASPDGETVVSAGSDKRFFVLNTTDSIEETYPLPFFPGTLALRDHEDAGLRVAVGVFRQESDSENEAQILVFETSTSSDVPRFRLRVPGLRWLHALVWDENAERLRVLAAIHDASRPTAPNEDPASPNRLALMDFDLGAGGGAAPTFLVLPPSLEKAESWETENPQYFALSENGLWLACRTRLNDSTNAIHNHGIGVWDVAQSAWHHRFGGREAEPHEIWLVDNDGDRVWSGREDDPKRDTRNGGPEWYDGVYAWDTRTSPPEGTEEAKPTSEMGGGRTMILCNDGRLVARPSGMNGATDIYDSQAAQPQLRHWQVLKRPAPPENAPNRYANNVWGAAFCANNTELVTSHVDGELWWWKVSDSRIA